MAGRCRVTPERAAAAAQAELLGAASAFVKPGGLLVYSTCSVEEDENQLQVDRFQQQRGTAFVPEPVPQGLVPPGAVTGAGSLQVLPGQLDTDGAFAARLRRV